MSLFTGLPDTSAAGTRLAAGYPGSTTGPCGAPPHPVLMTETCGSFISTIPYLTTHPKWFSAPVPTSLWLCLLGPEAAGRASLLGFSRKTVPCQGCNRGPLGKKHKWVQMRAKAGADSEQTSTTLS